MNLTTVLAVLAVLVLVVGRRLAGRPLETRRALVLPGVLVVVGLGSLQHLTDPVAVVFVAVLAVVSAAFGAARALSCRLPVRDGVLHVQYTWVTIGLWAGAIALRVAALPLERVLDPHAAAQAGATTTVVLGVGLLAEGLVVLQRAHRLGHAPTATARPQDLVRR